MNLTNTKTENLILDNVLPKDYGCIDGKSDASMVVTESKMILVTSRRNYRDTE